MISDAQERIAELLQQREAIDEELTQLRVVAEQELAEAQALVARLASLGKPQPSLQPIKQHRPVNDPVSETDFGNGIGGREPEMTRADFADELAELRERTAQKRVRLA